MTKANPYADEMQFGPAELETYLARIHYTGPLKPDLETLSALQRAHLISIPFENLDLHMGRPIEINIAQTFEKVIRRRRGGFCFELNSLYGALLAAIGFELDVLEGRVIRNGGTGIPFGHFMNLVHLDEPYLSDVGFGGGGSMEPLPLRLEEMSKNVCGRFMFSKTGDTYLFQSFSANFEREPQILFENVPRQLSDFYECCAWTQTAPESGFTKNIIAIQPMDNGKLQTIVALNYWKDGIDEGEPQALTFEERTTLLHDKFGINLEGGELVEPTDDRSPLHSK